MIPIDYAQANRAAIIGKRNPLSENVKTALAVIALFVAYAFVGTLEYEAAEATAAVSIQCAAEADDESTIGDK